MLVGLNIVCGRAFFIDFNGILRWGGDLGGAQHLLGGCVGILNTFSAEMVSAEMMQDMPTRCPDPGTLEKK